MTYTNPAAYEQFMGRWSARLAPLFVRFAGVEDGQRILDVGCGTGSLSRVLMAVGESIDVVGLDPVASYVSFARKRVTGLRAQFQVGTAEALPFRDETFDAALSLLVLQDMADRNRAVLEMARVTRGGGTVAACQWDFRDGMPMLSMFWQAAEAVAPESVARHRIGKPQSPGRRAGIQELADLWIGAGIGEVQMATLPLSMEFRCFDDFWRPFLGGATPTSTLAVAINRESGGALARVLGDMIVHVQADGSFALPAHAWAVAGIVTH